MTQRNISSIRRVGHASKPASRLPLVMTGMIYGLLETDTLISRLLAVTRNPSYIAYSSCDRGRGFQVGVEVGMECIILET